ncbi:MAG: two-component system response regulator [Elusimicrobiota bacterium]
MAEKILLVDDDSEMIALLRATLDAFGVILNASNGRDALRLVDEERPRLMILDVAMPGMSGFEVLEAARLIDRGVDVVMLSSEDDVAAAKRALEGGARAYMTKPFDSPALCAEVRRALEGGDRRDADQPWRVMPS